MILILSVLILGNNCQGLPDRPEDGPDLGCDISLSLEEKIEKFRAVEIELIGDNYEEAKLELNEGTRDIRTALLGQADGEDIPGRDHHWQTYQKRSRKNLSRIRVIQSRSICQVRDLRTFLVALSGFELDIPYSSRPWIISVGQRPFQLVNSQMVAVESREANGERCAILIWKVSKIWTMKLIKTW